MKTEINVSNPIQEIIFEDTANANAPVQVKAAAATVFYCEVTNPNFNDVFVKLFNMTANLVVVGTSAPSAIILCPASVAGQASSTTTNVFTTGSQPGLSFGGSGLSVLCVSTPGTQGTTSPLSFVRVRISYV